MVISAYQHCQPEYITIPTNGLLPDRVLAQAETIVRTCQRAQVGINLSLDGVGAVHDDIRGVPGNWERSMETWRRLKELQTRYANLVLTVHTVISRFNIHLFEETYEGLQSSSQTATSPR
jgi:MoaA/NifB/PqqE/SkfB family radical SAM enzyme